MDTCLSVALKDAGKVLLHCDHNSDDIGKPPKYAEQFLVEDIHDLRSDVSHGAADTEKCNDAEHAANAAHSRENCDASADGLGRSLEEAVATLSEQPMVSNIEHHLELDSEEVICFAAQCSTANWFLDGARSTSHSSIYPFRSASDGVGESATGCPKPNS